MLRRLDDADVPLRKQTERALQYIDVGHKSASSKRMNAGRLPLERACLRPLFTLPAFACLPLTLKT